MRPALILFIFFVLTGKISAQEDYFYAQNLIEEGRRTEAIRVLDHLIATGVYADRPRFAMMTLNLAGSNKLYLKDTAGSIKCYQLAMQCYDTLSAPRKSDDWNRKEYYTAGHNLARIQYLQKNYTDAKLILTKVKCPGNYYSPVGHDVLETQNHYYHFLSRVFQKLNQPDSAFACLRKQHDRELFDITRFNEIFDSVVTVEQVMFVEFNNQLSVMNDTISGYLYCVRGRTRDSTENCQWFINSDTRGLELVAGAHSAAANNYSFPGTVTELCLSPDQKYLAVKYHDAQETYVDIVRFPEIISEKKYLVRNNIRPSPASVIIVGWENSKLCIESDADLTKLNKTLFLTVSDLFAKKEDSHQFLFDPQEGKFTRK